MLVRFAMDFSVLEMKCVAFIFRLQGIQKEFRYIIVYGEKIVSIHFNDVTKL